MVNIPYYHSDIQKKNVNKNLARNIFAILTCDIDQRVENVDILTAEFQHVENTPDLRNEEQALELDAQVLLLSQINCQVAQGLQSTRYSQTTESLGECEWSVRVQGSGLCYVMSCYVTLYHVMPCLVMSCHVMLCYTDYNMNNLHGTNHQIWRIVREYETLQSTEECQRLTGACWG